MPKKTLVIVESPTKARTIKKFLGPHFQVEASVGHVRDLPQKASDIPQKMKEYEWSRLGIDVDNDFAPLYITPKDKTKVVRHLKQKLKDADELLLATDEDREGESISWHLVQLLKPKVPVRRMVFHEITRPAIEHALAHGREIDSSLVNAQETRRILDRLYGYTLSPLVWKKIAYGLSAGRVQSPGLRLIVDRERERIAFTKAVYWDLKAGLRRSTDPAGQGFEARLESVDGRRVASGRDFDAINGTVLEGRDVVVLTEDEARKLTVALADDAWKVSSVAEKRITSRPTAPFITSSLQQEGNRKLRLSARETMRTAQRLYEQGFITYMRTDSPVISEEGILGARSAVTELYGDEYLSPEARQFKPSAKDAQEAHEAIRPAGEHFAHPDETELSGSERALYELIWKRTLASQMADAQKSSTTAKINVQNAVFTATGTRILFPGFIRVYVEGKDDPDAALDDRETFLPELTEDQLLDLDGLESLYHETKPPARYTDASLVQRLEKEGIGRPSTYASIISVLFERKYVRRQGNALIPTFTGYAVMQLLEKHFHYLVEYSFTSELEANLDRIADGGTHRLDYLREFYLGEDGLRHRVSMRESEIDPNDCRTVQLPQLKNVPPIKIGKFGPYIVHNIDGQEIHASIPEEIAPADLTEDDVLEIIEIQKRGPVPIGHDPKTSEPVFCLVGRYGPYVQLGEKTDETPKPRRATLPKDVTPKDTTLELALKLLSLPRTLGQHPETGNEVVANNGRFGPYVVHDGDFRSLKAGDDVYSVSLGRALEILAEPKKGRGSKLLRDLGTDEQSGMKIAIYEGRYGPYIKFGKKNITLPEERRTGEAIEKLQLSEAMEIVKKSGKV
ncbi:MAG: type I DNA topoisomerase [Spirochaetales bacterium]|nr:type I DNA topoisomerase [Spirochaetales bacterium]